jgi:hypothetical protein
MSSEFVPQVALEKARWTYGTEHGALVDKLKRNNDYSLAAHGVRCVCNVKVEADLGDRFDEITKIWMRHFFGNVHLVQFN